MKTSIHSQSGATLIVALVLLLLLTIFGIAASQSVELQVKSTQIAQGRYESFQAAYSEIIAQVNSSTTVDNDLITTLFVNAINSTTAEHSLASGEIISDVQHVDQSASIRFLGVGGLVSGSEIDSQVYRFELDSVATSSLDVDSNQTQGIAVEFPSGDE